MIQHTILLIDDEANVLHSLQRLFRADGYQVITAGCAREGFAALERESVDLIICDHKMPGMNGCDFFKTVLERFPATINILLTGFADLEMALEAINNCGIYKFILKPWNNEDLKITVKRALEHHDISQQNESKATELRKRDNILQQLERQHPGITRTSGDGIYRIQDDMGNRN